MTYSDSLLRVHMYLSLLDLLHPWKLFACSLHLWKFRLINSLRVSAYLPTYILYLT